LNRSAGFQQTTLDIWRTRLTGHLAAFRMATNIPGVMQGQHEPAAVRRQSPVVAHRKPLLAVCHLTAIFPDASINRVYLDPPFNSNANGNVVFKEASGDAGQAQFHVLAD
jgi:16S rRNA G966 N2-methylase RsmD